MPFLGAVSKMTEWSLFFPKQTNIMVIQAYALTSNTEEAEVDSSLKTYKTF